MLIFGLLLILLAAAVIAYMVLATGGMDPVSINYGILNIEMLPLWLYLAGVATLAVAALGLWMAGAGARTKARRSREVRELRKQAKDADRRATRTEDRSSLDRPSTAPGTTAPRGTTPTTSSSTPPPPRSTP
ncbi:MULTISPECIES: hypothetical protein [unclassified Ornithinimicrobium]|uniref:LapA family protein n=1 Tax=unclassified Ornithinimicrobium TaxID=2615080 RepID=UPI003854E6B2